MNDVIYESNLDTALGTVPCWHCCRTHLRGEKKAISRLINLIFSLLLAVGRISELSQLLPFTTAPSLEKSQSTIHSTSPKKQYFEQLNPFLQAAKRSDFLFQKAPPIMIHIWLPPRFMANLNWLLIRRLITWNNTKTHGDGVLIFILRPFGGKARAKRLPTIGKVFVFGLFA